MLRFRAASAPLNELGAGPSRMNVGSRAVEAHLPGLTFDDLRPDNAGATESTRMLSGARSIAMHRVIPRIAAFVVL